MATILVVDDQPTNRQFLITLLGYAGHRLLEASDGLEALEQLEQNPDVELLLVDWNMPGMDGSDFIRAVRARRAYDAVRVLMVTSESQGE